jgi:hypothetical protein
VAVPATRVVFWRYAGTEARTVTGPAVRARPDDSIQLLVRSAKI